jgi:hypothetical protein
MLQRKICNQNKGAGAIRLFEEQVINMGRV